MPLTGAVSKRTRVPRRPMRGEQMNRVWRWDDAHGCGILAMIDIRLTPRRTEKVSLGPQLVEYEKNYDVFN